MIRAILFDLGGVLVDVRRERAHRVWERESGRPGAEFDAALFAEGRKEALDRGRLAPQEFFAAAADALGDPALRAPLETAWRAIVSVRVGLLPLLDDLRATCRLGVLSNIDPVHFDALRGPLDLDGRFDVVVPSFRTGALKPEPAAFRPALGALGAPPEAVRFLDDRSENVRAARALGLDARRVTTEREVCAALASPGRAC